MTNPGVAKQPTDTEECTAALQQARQLRTEAEKLKGLSDVKAIASQTLRVLSVRREGPGHKSLHRFPSAYREACQGDGTALLAEAVRSLLHSRRTSPGEVDEADFNAIVTEYSRLLLTLQVVMPSLAQRMLFEFSDVIQGAFVAYVASGPTPSYQQRAREALGILEYLWDFTDLDKSGSKFREFLFADNMAAIRYALETLQTEEKKQWRMPLFDGEDKALHVRARDELTTVVWAMLVTLFSTMWGIFDALERQQLLDLDGVNAMVSLLLYQLRGFEELVQQLGEHEATQHILLDYWSHWLARAGETRRLCDVAAVHMAGDGEKERKVQMEKLMGDIAEVVDKIAAAPLIAKYTGASPTGKKMVAVVHEGYSSSAQAGSEFGGVELSLDTPTLALIKMELLRTETQKNRLALNSLCLNCGKLEEDGAETRFPACSKCKIAVYCGKECQRSHWKSGHKHLCREGPSAVSAAPATGEASGGDVDCDASRADSRTQEADH